MRLALIGLAATLLASPVTAQTLVYTTPDKPTAATTEQAKPPAPLDMARFAEAEAVIATMYPNDKRDQMFADIFASVNQMMANSFQTMSAQMGVDRDPELEKIVASHFEKMIAEASADLIQNMDGMFAAFARAYARRFSKEELTQIRLFFATPTGSKYASESAQIMSDPDVAAWQEAYQQRVVQRIMGDVKSLGEKLAKHKATQDNKK